MRNGMLSVVDGDIVSTCNELLKGILRMDEIDALLVPQEVPSKTTSFDVLISDPDKLSANVLAPVMPVSTASMVSKITKAGGTDKRIGVVMRPCQIRALVELVKLNQANMDNIVIIGIDCPGTFSVNTYSELSGDGKDPTKIIVGSLKGKGDDAKKYLRSACAICKDPVPTNADIVIGTLGVDVKKELFIQANTEQGERLLDGIELGVAEDEERRDEAVANVRKEKAEQMVEFLESSSSPKGIEALAKFYDKCVNCHNCMNACPICYCKECLFDSSVFDAEAGRYVRKAKSKGLFKMPDDSLLFHVTRMNHMILSCVECGLCEQACPSHIPLMDVIIPVAERAQKELDYQPGKDPEERTPMVVYREDEYTDVGES